MKIPLKYIKYFHISQLARYEHQRRWLVQAYQEDRHQAKDGTARQRVLDDMRMELDLHDEEVRVYLTNKWAAKARRLMIPMPARYDDDGSETPFWEQGQYTGDWYLTNRGLAILRSEIRREHKESYERWTPIVTAITGIVGAVTGMIAVILGHAK
ncbi:hypothetical protein [Aquitalea magnusonii]|uniref:hypothetical protein n=1 Tax=Aquitalea magnusonii TaxID=332411 RepID=UPI000B5CFF21|nr:hypothetical protein [Aquitalea magnusonii]